VKTIKKILHRQEMFIALPVAGSDGYFRTNESVRHAAGGRVEGASGDGDAPDGRLAAHAIVLSATAIA
jgi:hypothetical protein